MLEKIKKSFRSASSKNGSYSVGMIALVICMVIVVNLIAGQLPENVKSIDISDNNIYGVSKTSKKALNKLDKKVTFKIYAEKDSTDTRIKSFIKKYTALSDKISVKWIDPVLHPAALTKAGVDKNTIVISCKDTGKTKSVSFDDILENEDILLKEILGFQEEKIPLDFLRYALDAMRENMKELWDEWREK